MSVQHPCYHWVLLCGWHFTWLKMLKLFSTIPVVLLMFSCEFLIMIMSLSWKDRKWLRFCCCWWNAHCASCETETAVSLRMFAVNQFSLRSWRTTLARKPWNETLSLIYKQWSKLMKQTSCENINSIAENVTVSCMIKNACTVSCVLFFSTHVGISIHVPKRAKFKFNFHI